jgi:hypothetical protein
MPLVRVKQCSCPGPYKDREGYIRCIHRCASFMGKPRPPWAPDDTGGGLVLSERTATLPLTRQRVMDAVELVLGETREDFQSWIERIAVQVYWKGGL